MRKLLYILFFLPFFAKGQTTYKILADSTRLGSVANTGNELIIENDTRDTLGVLANNGKGRTSFKAIRLQQLTDSTFRLLLGTTAQGQTITIRNTGSGGSGATYTLALNATRDSLILTGSNGTRYAVRDSSGVPYTGAVTDVDLGANVLNAESLKVTGVNGDGHIHLRHQASDATAQANNTALFADASGDLKYKNDALYYVELRTSGNTADRVYRFPDSTGTVALLSNVGRKVDSIYRENGKDSIIFTISGARYAVKDSTGGGGATTIYNGNGSLTSDRTVTNAGNDLVFTDGGATTGHFIINQTAFADSVFTGRGAWAVTSTDNVEGSLLLYGFNSGNNIGTKIIGQSSGTGIDADGVTIQGTSTNSDDIWIFPVNQKLKVSNLPINLSPSAYLGLDNNDRMVLTDVPRRVDSLYRTPGKDSIIFNISGARYAIKDSTGGGSTPTLTYAKNTGQDSSVITYNGTRTAIMDNGYVLLSTSTASGAATVDFTIDTTIAWTQLMVIGYNILPATDNVTFRLRVGIGSTIQTGATDYGYGYRGGFSVNYTQGDHIELAKNFDNGTAGSVMININRPNAVGAQKGIFWQGVSAEASNPTLYIYDQVGSGSYKTNGRPLTDIRLYMSSGNISGEFKLYGLK